ncbi:MAG TPA: YicC/YloC family endoribonuclease [Gemmatimonadaceae bacterium]|nr:YicC/YloC family endoribonuclease [Gemmatimonadaceae bacterium]
MTGFGTADGDVGNARIVVEVRSVNHRFFNPSIKLPSVLARWEGDVREALRKHVARGHVSCTARLERREAAAAGIDEQAFARAVEQLRALSERHQLGESLDTATILRMPGVIAGAPEEIVVESPDTFLAIVDAAAEALTKMRLAEGLRMGAIVSERVALVQEHLARIGKRAPERIIAHREKLRANLQELAGGIAVDPQRLAMEVAVHAERLDVGEEMDRFGAHIDAFRVALADAGTEPVGKRLGFLLQEMLREANTTGSKANDAEMQQDVVAIKEELERIREQVENIE